MRAIEQAFSGFGRLLICFCLYWLPHTCPAAPRHVYLTWQGDTSTTITVNYQTLGEAQASTVYYDTKPRKGNISDYRFHAAGAGHKIEGLEDGRTIHWVELTRLKPGETYYFVAGDPQQGFTAERKFRTIPDGHQPIRFVVGGDMSPTPSLPVLSRQAARQEPSFVAVGGDIAYANDRMTNYARWDAWLDAWEQCMLTPHGFTIPMVLAIGNHDARGGAGPSPTNALFYFRYFAQQHDRSYYSRKFGKNFALYLLDSGHLSPHGPEQAAWLDAELEADRQLPHRFAVYHVPLYPGNRLYEAPASAAGRKAWLPVFDKHHLTTAFEHHDHVFKRTRLLRSDRPDPNGTLYLGDGGWGAGARSVSKVLRWYQEKIASVQHFWVVDVSRNRVEYRAVNIEGKVFDVYPPGAPGAKDAELVFKSLPQLPSPVPIPNPQSIRIAGIVLKWLRGDKAANYRRAEALIREAAAYGAQIVCTTECFLDGYAIGDKSIPLDQYRSLGEPIPEGEYFRKLSALARELHILLVAGMLEADGQARYNTAVSISPAGELLAKYHKQRLDHEAVRNSAGSESAAFDTPFGKLGVMICADRRFPDVVKAFSDRGADFLLCPAGGMFGPKTNDPILQARSRENQKYIIFVHPAEFLVTAPDGTIVQQTLLGDKLLIAPDQVGTAADSQRVFYFDLPRAAKP